MSSPGGGGINLPPLSQQIFVSVNGAGKAQGMFSGVTRGANTAGSAMGGLNSQIGGMNRSMMNTVPTYRAAGDAMRMTGSLMMYKVAMPLITIGKNAIQASKDFETSMGLIKGLVGVTAVDIKKMSSAILDMAGSVGKAPEELADALYFITSAGIKNTTEALDVLNVSARAASAGLGTTQGVADVATSVMNAYAPGMYNAAIATDVLVAAVREGKAEAASFAPAMGKVLPVAASFGLKFQDVAASVAALTRQGAPAGTAAIQLRQILSSLLKPTAQATAELSKYGISAATLRETIQNKGFFAGLEQLNGALGDNAESMSKVFGNVRPLTAISALIGPSMQKNALIFQELGSATGDTDKAFQAMQETLGFKMNAASAEMRVAFVRIGDAISPFIKTLADLGKQAASAFAFFARNDWLIRTAAGFAGAAIGLTIFTRSLATFIRLKAFTTVALQGLANGFRDQSTGMVKNIITGQSYISSMGAVGASSTAAGAAATGTSAATSGLAARLGITGAAARATAGGIGALGAVTTAAATSQINMSNSLFKNIQLLIAQRGASIGSTGAMAAFRTMTAATALTLKVFYATIGKAMLGMGALVLGMMAATFVISKTISLFKNMNKPVKSVSDEVRGLKDELSNFRVAPLVIGVNIEYNYSSNGKSTSSITAQDQFRNFLLPRDEENKLTEEGKKIQKSLQSVTDNVSKMTKEARMSGALAAAGEFAGDVATAGPARDFYADLYGVSRSELEKGLINAERDGAALIKARISKGFDDARETKSGGGYLRATSTGGDFGTYIARLKKEYRTEAAVRQTLERDMASQQGITRPLSDSLSSTSGSALQFVKTLEVVSDSVIAAGGSTKDAEIATTEYARAAIKSVDGNTKGSTVFELLTNNAGVFSTKIDALTAGTKNYAEEQKISVITSQDVIDSFNKTSSAVAATSQSVFTLSDDIASLSVAFSDGLNGSINDAASLMEAYTKALKEVKRGQEALFSSQMGMVDAEIAYRGAVQDSIQALGKSGGNFNSNSEEALKARKAVAEAAQSVLDIGNATYANTAGDEKVRGEAGAVAAQKAYDAYSNQLKKIGMSDTTITEMFSSILGKTLDLSGTRIEFTPEWISKTFSTDDIDLSKASDAGKDTSGGIATGVGAGEKDLRTAAQKSAQAIIDEYKASLGIKSPSTVMHEKVGIPIAQGVANGITAGTPFAIKAALDLSKDIWSAMSGADQMRNYRTSGSPGPKKVAALTVAQAAAAAKAKAKANENPYDDILTGLDTTGKTSKADDQAALAKTVKLQGSKVSKGVYDLMATTLGGKSAKDLGGNFLTKFAEGVNAAKSLIKTPITDLIKSITSEVTSKLTVFTALIDAKLNLDQAKVDLKKFLVLNTAEMLNSSISAATRAKNQAANKFGGNQGTDVTRYEKSQIKTAAAAAQQAARDYRLGKISFAEYQDAQDALVNTQDEAKEASSDLAKATNDLTDAEAAKESAAGRTAAAAANVVIAQDSLTTAYINAKAAGKDVADTFGNIAGVVIPGLAGATVGYFNGLASLVTNKDVAPFISPDMTKLITGASGEADKGALVNSPTYVAPTEPDAQMPRAVARANFLADANKRLKTKYKTVTEYINGGANSTRDAARQALWDKYVKDNNVAAAAKGGALSPGRLTLVGESGPELITPNAAARITPYSVLERYARTASHDTQNGSQGSSNPINITVNNPVPERASDSIARRMQNMSSLGLFG